MPTIEIPRISATTFSTPVENSTQQIVTDVQNQQHQQAIASENAAFSQTVPADADTVSLSDGSADAADALLSAGDLGLNDPNAADAQSALAAYAGDSASAADTRGTPGTIADALIQSRIQIGLVASILNPAGTPPASLNSPQSSANRVIDVLNAAYPAAPAPGVASVPQSGSSATAAASPSDSSLTSAPASAATTLTPYDTLLSAIDLSIATRPGVVQPAPVNLKSTGNFINTVV